MSKVVLAVVASLFVGSVAFGAELGTAAVRSTTGSTKYVTVSGAAGTVGTILTANLSRVGGYVVNTSTNYLHVSLTASTTTGIEAGYALVYPTADSYGRDRINLNSWPIVYQGAMYFTAYESPTATKGAGSMSAIEFK